ncbi:hypothetical protein V8G54_032675 [Vigna mungo]|uniref:Putative plant transposon protein domain-containing protein n=1 Tax=Vigna mungo TaxID=3915 RepID=A0AAQ3MLV6_VIGMU
MRNTFFVVENKHLLMERMVIVKLEEISDFMAEYLRRGWQSFGTYPASTNIVVVKEFYANARTFIEEAAPFLSYVRGRLVPFDAQTINSFLGTEWQDINMGQSLMLYSILLGKFMNVGRLIAEEICQCAHTAGNKSPLGHPSLITHLCQLVGVDISSPSFERPRQVIDLPFYNQYFLDGEEGQ